MQWFPDGGLWDRIIKMIRPHNPTLHCNPISVFIKYGIDMIKTVIGQGNSGHQNLFSPDK